MRVPIPVGGPFPVTMNLLGVGTVGARWDVNAHGGLRTGEDGCLAAELGASAQLTPYGTLSAEGRAGIGYPGIGGGAYAAVDLLHVEIPVSGSVEVDVGFDGGELNGEVTIAGDVDLDVSTLSGEVGLYLEALTYEKKWGQTFAGEELVDASLLDIDYSYSATFWEFMSQAL